MYRSSGSKLRGDRVLSQGHNAFGIEILESANEKSRARREWMKLVNR